MILYKFDVLTLVGMLFWANLTCLALSCAYIFCNHNAGDRKLPWSTVQAKALLTASFFLVQYRGVFPDILSINLGNTLMLIGFFAEARTILLLIGEEKSRIMKAIFWIAAVSVAVYNLALFLYPGTMLRITVGSAAIFATLVVPTGKLLFSRSSTPFKRIVGLFYLMYIVLLLPRGMYFLFNPDLGVFTNSLIQVLSFGSLMLLTIFSLPAFLLLMKEEADRKLREMAQTDFLTGLYNRQFFLSSVAAPFERHKREQMPCSIVFMDIDHFKRVNDTLGHAFGDVVLRSTADVLRKTVRGYDLPCRFGGEEFAAFIDSSTPDAGKATAERIRTRVADLKFAENPDFTVTISLGVATGVPQSGDTLDTFFKDADEALYEAKETGRNKVVERQTAEP